MKNIYKSLALMVGLFVMPLSSMAADQAAYEATTDKMIEAMNKLATLLESVEDEASADAASAGIKKLTQEEMVPLAKEMNALGEPDPEMEKALEAKYQEKIEASSNRMMTAMMALAQKDPALMTKIQGAMEEFGQAMTAVDSGGDVPEKDKDPAEAAE